MMGANALDPRDGAGLARRGDGIAVAAFRGELGLAIRKK
jgi:hypothetical protein